MLQFVDGQDANHNEMLIVPVAFARKARKTTISQARKFEVIHLGTEARACMMRVHSEIGQAFFGLSRLSVSIQARGLCAYDVSRLCPVEVMLLFRVEKGKLIHAF